MMEGLKMGRKAFWKAAIFTILIFCLLQVELWDVQSGRHASVKTLDGTTVFERSVDVAVGDLDKAVDDNGMYHDEIVVARTYQSADGKSGFAIDVLDKDLNTIGSDAFYSGAPQSLVAVAIGDFDGDGYLEVAAGMTYHTAATGVQVRLYRFARNQDGSLVTPLQLQHVSDYSSPAEAAPFRGFDMTVGDFDGDGKDEIYFVTTARVDNPIIPQTGLNHSILKADQDLKLTRFYYQLDTPAEFIVLGQLRTQSGLFKFDPPNGWTMNRRQIVTCFIGGDPFYDGRGPNNQIWCEFYAFSAKPTGGFDRVSTTERSVGAYLKGTTFYTDMDLAVGNYIGHGLFKNQTSPLMYPVVAYSESRPGHPYVKYTGAKVFAIPGQTHFVAGDVFSHVPASNGSGTEPIMPVVATALDGDGDTWRLGPPMHLTIENLINLDYIIQEPPKHVDYLPLKPGDPDSA
jgi:hypothetical protein